jgi:DNA-binding PadR family transcriptional regulator
MADSPRRNPTLSPSPEYALLGFLAQHPAHGYDLHQQLAQHLGQVWHVSLSQVYSILNRLENNGYITGTVQEQDKLPNRRRFRLTTPGRRHFETWLHATSGCSTRAIRLEFTTRLFFIQLLNPPGLHDLVEAQVAETRNCLTHLQAMLGDLPAEQKFNRLGLELRIRQLNSVIDWMLECEQVLQPNAAPNRNYNPN